jgi:CBS domain containing-hemolysin-like protein
VNNLVNIAIVICSAQVINLTFKFNHATVEFLFTGVLVTFLLLLFGEILPKIVAQSANVRLALTFAQPLTLLRWIVLKQMSVPKLWDVTAICTIIWSQLVHLRLCHASLFMKM